MKIGIVIPLKAKMVSKDWNATCENLKATILSVVNQTSQNFHCVVIGHDKPDFMTASNLNLEKIDFLKFDRFLPPLVTSIESDNQLKYEFDRCHKILAGIVHLKQSFSNITHWFSLDADDLIHKEFVELMQAYYSGDAIILDSGYVYFKNTGIINNENEFSAYCGSSALISDSLIDIPEIISENSHRCIPFGNYSHVHMRMKLQEIGYKVLIPKERVVMYVRNNGENISNAAYANTIVKRLKKFIKMIVKFRFVDSSTKKAFGLK